jgi:hypothetical protein
VKKCQAARTGRRLEVEGQRVKKCQAAGTGRRLEVERSKGDLLDLNK